MNCINSQEKSTYSYAFFEPYLLLIPIIYNFRLSEITLIKNKPPADGVCLMTFDENYALVSYIKITCLGWQDPEEMTIKYYNFLYTSVADDGSLVRTTLVNTLKPEIFAVLPLGTFRISVEICDILDAVTEYQVGSITTIMPSEQQVEQFNITDKIEKFAGSQVISMYIIAYNSIQQESVHIDLQQFERTLTSDSSFSKELEELILKLTGRIHTQLGIADSFPFPINIKQATISSDVIVSAISLISGLDIGSYGVDMQNREKLVSSIERIISSISTIDVASADEYEPLLKNAMTIKASLIKSTNAVLRNNKRSPPGDKIFAPDMDYDVDVGERIPKDLPEMYDQNSLKRTREQAGPLINRMDKLIKEITDAMFKKMVKGDYQEVSIDEGVICILAKFEEQDLKEKNLVISTQTDNPAILVLPKGFCPSYFIDEFTMCEEEFDIRMIISAFETRIYSPSAHFISNLSYTVDVDALSRGNIVNVKDQLPLVHIVVPHVLESSKFPFTDVATSRFINNHVPLVYHLFKISSPQIAYKMEIIPSDDSNDWIIFLDYGRFPTPSKYSRKFFIEDFDNINGTLILLVDTASNHNKTGQFIFGIGKLLPIDNKTKPLLLSDLDKEFNTSYKIRLTATGCYFFDSSSDYWKDGATVEVTDFNDARTNCSTTHFTEFGVGYLPSPLQLTIDLININVAFTDEMTVLVTLATLAVSLIILLIYGVCMDIFDSKKRVSIPLPDNKASDSYAYELLFHTGPDSEASCESNILFIVAGEFGETKVRRLPKPTPHLFRRYQHNNFVMSTPASLGPLHNLRIMHDNSGRPPYDSWQLERVIIHDLQTHTFYEFETNTWLSLDRKDRNIDCTFQCTNNVSTLTFGQKFYSEFHKTINNDHLWLSIFLCPVGSRHRRTERILIALLFLSVSALLSSLYYWYEGEKAKEEGLNIIFNLEVSLSEFIIGLLVHLCSYLPAIFFAFIMKRACPMKFQECRAKLSLEAQRKSQFLKSGAKKVAAKKSKLRVDGKKKYARKVDPSYWSLPCWFRWISWFLVLGVIGASGYYVFIFCMEWGQARSQKWVMTFIISFCISFILTEWIRISIIALYASTCKKKQAVFDDIDCDENLPYIISTDKTHRQKNIGSSKVQEVSLIKGVEKSRVNKTGHKLRSQREMRKISKGILVYCCFLIVLIIITFDQNDINGFRLQRHYTKMFIRKEDAYHDLTMKVRFANICKYLMKPNNYSCIGIIQESVFRVCTLLSLLLY